MVNVDLDNDLSDRVDIIVSKKKIKYPNKKNFVDKAVETELEKEEIGDL